MTTRTISSAIFLLLCLGSLLLTKAVTPLQRDHLTPQEVDLVKEAQILDKRIEVFIKAADRRLMVLNGAQAANAKQLKKDAELWGDLPTGTQAELIGDIARILDEAITNLDDVSSRDERNPLIPKALRRLAQAVNNIMTQVEPFRTKAKSDAEVASLEMLNEDAQQILEAAKRLPPEVETKKKKN
jgi:hypothetical protein